jgi:hypothetical protein
MQRASTRLGLLQLSLLIAVVGGVLGCPKKAPPMLVDEAGPPPASVPTVTELAPLVDEAGVEDAAPEAAPKKYTGPAINPNQQKIAQCCAAMRAQAKLLGQSPEGFQLNAAAMYCDTVEKQVGPLGTAPEFAQIRAMLKTVKLPSACQY